MEQLLYFDLFSPMWLIEILLYLLWIQSDYSCHRLLRSKLQTFQVFDCQNRGLQWHIDSNRTLENPNYDILTFNRCTLLNELSFGWLISPVPRCTMTLQSVWASHWPAEQQIASVCSSFGREGKVQHQPHMYLSRKTRITCLAAEKFIDKKGVCQNRC